VFPRPVVITEPLATYRRIGFPAEDRCHALQPEHLSTDPIRKPASWVKPQQPRARSIEFSEAYDPRNHLVRRTDSYEYHVVMIVMNDAVEQRDEFRMALST
jgi:hypothetical protein